MAYENLCMYCFEPMNGRQICPHCGRDSRAAVPQIQMLPGSRVYHGRFLIGRALGQDANGIVYAAFDTKKESPLRIREYLPRDCAERLNDGAVVPRAGREDQFDQGMHKLRATVEDVDDPRKRHFYFEENGTAYIAQRKAAAADAPEAEEEDDGEDRSGNRRLLVIAVVAAAVVIAAAAGLISLFNGAMNTPQDVVQNPTVNPDEIWIPFETPTPTPYTAPTFAALVDPDLEWIDFDYEDTPVSTLEPESTEVVGDQGWSDEDEEPLATPGTDSSKYKLVNSKSNEKAVTNLQKQLVKLGWMSKKQISGKYDSATVKAVKALQTYVNKTFDPDPALKVDGIAGPKTQLWMYEASVAKPTAKPTVVPEDRTIQEGSSAEDVRSVQQKLITLGLMPGGSADGRYGAATVTAVKKFQQRVNKLQGYAVLDVTGNMDPLSQSFLTHYAREWERLRKATASPVPTGTATPKPEKIDEFDTTVIDANADPDSIKRVQQMLIGIGMMSEGSADGKYGRGTSSAVMQFQQWVNTMRSQQTLNISGVVDPLTRQYLEYCYDREIHPYATLAPTATPRPTKRPTPTPTAEPEPEEENEAVSVGPDSPKETVTYVQQLLHSVKLLKSSQINGKYDKATRAAVKAFQKWVNSQRGKGTVPENGLLDDTSRRYLVYCSDHDMVAGNVTDDAPTQAPTAAPTEAPTEVPTEAPTEVPTEAPTEAPTETPDAGGEGGGIVIDPSSEPESIQFVQEMLSAAGLLDASQITGSYDDATREAVMAFQRWVNRERGEDTVAVNGIVDDATRRYLEYTFDHEITVSDGAPEPTEAPTEAPTAEPAEAPSAVTGVSIIIDGLSAGDDIIYVTDGRIPVSWAAEGEAASYSVKVEDAGGSVIMSREGISATGFTVDSTQMKRGEVYTLTVGAKPKEGEAAWRTARFALPNREISAPSIRIAGVEAGSSAVTVEDASFTISWSAEGDVACYFVTIADEAGDVVGELSETSQTSMTVKASDVRAGELYTLTVGALPVNGGRSDMRESSATFTVPAQDAGSGGDGGETEPEIENYGEPEGDDYAEPEGDAVEPETEPEGDDYTEPEGDDYAEPGEVVEEAPTATPAPTKKPAKKTSGKPVINVDGPAFQKNGISYMTGKTITVSWMAEGKVDSYYVYIENAKGQRVTLGRTTDTSKSVPTGKLAPGKYTLHVGVLPKGGGKKDIRWGTYTFAIPTAKEIAAARNSATPVPSAEPEETGEPADGEADEAGDEEAEEGEFPGDPDAEIPEDTSAEEFDGLDAFEGGEA